jgi:hypothetical protein
MNVNASISTRNAAAAAAAASNNNNNNKWQQRRGDNFNSTGQGSSALQTSFNNPYSNRQ